MELSKLFCECHWLRRCGHVHIVEVAEEVVEVSAVNIVFSPSSSCRAKSRADDGFDDALRFIFTLAQGFRAPSAGNLSELTVSEKASRRE